MQVNLLAYGESMPSTLPPADVTVGINYAASSHQVDWLSALDAAERFNRGVIKPTIGVVTAQCYVDGWLNKFADLNVMGHDWCVVPDCIENIANSSIYGLLFAHQVLNSDEINCYGIDMQGDVPRWNDERKRWSSLVRWLRSKGIVVNEYGKHQTPK